MSLNSKVSFILDSKLAFISIFLLFLIQLFSDFAESTYILCLMTLSLNQNVLTILFLFSSLFLIGYKKDIPRIHLGIIGQIMILCRVLEPLFDTTLRMIISGLGVGCFMIFFPGFLLHQESSNEEHNTLRIGLGLTIATTLSILLRTLNSTIDLSTWSWGQSIGWILAIPAAWILFQFQKKPLQTKIRGDQEIENVKTVNNPISKKRLFILVLGIMSVFFMISFAFSSPGIISRWTEGNYLFIIGMVGCMLVLYIISLIYNPHWITHLNSWILVLWNIVFVGSFVSTIIINQISFPKILAAYPIETPPTTILHYIPLIITLITFPILFIDFMVFIREIIKSNPKPSTRSIGGFFTIGGLYLLIMMLSLIFTSTWGFIPLIGFYFRDMFWLIYLLVLCVLLVPLVRLPKISFEVQKLRQKTRVSHLSSVILILIFLGTIFSAIGFEAHPNTPTNEVTSLKILTYNLQQGVDEGATKNYDGQLELIRTIDADIIGLQETSKIAGSSDIVRYMANKLNLFSYFGPKGVTGTTGVALLSKYPIKNARTIYHYDENVDRKQTATIEAEISIGTQTFNIYITHTFGRMETKSILISDVLMEAAGKENIIFMGDFNFRPFSSAYNDTITTLNDSWRVKWPTGINGEGQTNLQHIDHVFVSPGTLVVDCQYITDPQSDHPAYCVRITW